MGIILIPFMPIIFYAYTLWLGSYLLASILLLILPIFNFTTDAKWAIGITAIFVDIFATLQFLEWRKQM